jgi:hypothetical protein
MKYNPLLDGRRVYCICPLRQWVVAVVRVVVGCKFVVVGGLVGAGVESLRNLTKRALAAR